MGKVFTWDEINSKKIPQVDSFHKVSSEIREILLPEKSIVTALLFGSVVRGDFNIRSDIDCVIIYETGRERR